MRKRRRLFPREGLAPNAKWSLMIQKFVQGIKQSLVVNMQDVFEEVDSFLLLLFVIVVLFEL